MPAVRTGRRRPGSARRPGPGRRAWVGAAVALLVVVAGTVWLAAGPGRGGEGRAGTPVATSAAPPVVGGDLHTLAVVGDALYVAGHAAAAVSRDGGRTWQPVATLSGADVMGWAVTSQVVLAGGHPGLFRSTDGGGSFARVGGAGAVRDVHALGGAGGTVYLASPEAGVLASADGGATWEVRNAQVGRTFMGTILVDPADPTRLLAPDMSGGVAASRDGGRTWVTLGGPPGAMAVAWNPTDTRQLLAVGMGGAARSDDGGASWRRADVPTGASAVAYDASGRTVYAGVLEGQRVRVFASTDGGLTWSPTG